MKLYYSKGACSLAVRITLHELKIVADYESVNLKTKITASNTNYLTINPKGAVPALVLQNQETLTENAAIQQYLADQAHATHLLPPVGDFNRYRVIEWLNFVSTDLHKSCGPLFNADVPNDIKESIFKPLLKNKLHFVNQHLATHTYLLGNDYTLPDSYLFTVLRWVPHFGFDLATEWPQLSRYFMLMKERPSVQKALQEEGLS